MFKQIQTRPAPYVHMMQDICTSKDVDSKLFPLIISFLPISNNRDFGKGFSINTKRIAKMLNLSIIDTSTYVNAIKKSLKLTKYSTYKYFLSIDVLNGLKSLTTYDIDEEASRLFNSISNPLSDSDKIVRRKRLTLQWLKENKIAFNQSVADAVYDMDEKEKKIILYTDDKLGKYNLRDMGYYLRKSGSYSFSLEDILTKDFETLVWSKIIKSYEATSKRKFMFIVNVNETCKLHRITPKGFKKVVNRKYKTRVAYTNQHIYNTNVEFGLNNKEKLGNILCCLGTALIKKNATAKEKGEIVKNMNEMSKQHNYSVSSKYKSENLFVSQLSLDYISSKLEKNTVDEYDRFLNSIISNAVKRAYI